MDEVTRSCFELQSSRQNKRDGQAPREYDPEQRGLDALNQRLLPRDIERLCMDDFCSAQIGRRRDHREHLTRAALILVTTAMLLIWSAMSVFGWEASLWGEYENRIRWWGRTGENDLFGMASAQEHAQGAVNVGFAGPNIYNTGALPTVPAPSSNFLINLGNSTGRQMLITRGGFSPTGSNALSNDSRLTLWPTIRVNEAISIRGVLNIGGYRNKYSPNAGNSVIVPPFERYYVSQSSINATDTAALISVEQFWASVQLPWGVFSMGARAFPLGTGATFGENTRADMYQFVVPYGPFRFMSLLWPGRSQESEAWATVPDGTQKDNLFLGFVCTFDAGNLSLGAATILRRFHGNNAVPFAENRDDNTLVNLGYLKFNNGRFFANAEYAWINIDRYRTIAPKPEDASAGRTDQTIFAEGYHFFSEAGVFVGPVKLTLMYAVASGPVLNDANRLRNVWAGGFFLGAATPAPFQPGANPKIYVPWAVNYQAMAPYEFLMFTTYAGGNNGGWNALDITAVADDHGMMSDAFCFAGRLDHAVASNLNVWGSYIWAHRLERAGTYLGQYQSSGSLAAGSIPNLRSFYARAGRSFGTSNDYISNGFIGEELNCGIDWKLLEGLTFEARYSRWQPGEWFREAYQSVVVAGDGTAVTTGVLDTRDAIHAIQTSFTVNF